MRNAIRIGAAVVWLGLGQAAEAQFPPVDQGVVCFLDGTAIHGPAVDDVDEDYNSLDVFRPDSEFPIHAPFDPLDGPARPAAQTTLDLTLSKCRWLGGTELDACFAEGTDLRYEIVGTTVSDTACASRTFSGGFRLLEEDGTEVDETVGCTGNVFCGHTASEIGIDVARRFPGVTDPGGVGDEPNDGRAEGAPLTESCTLELKTHHDGTEVLETEKRFGMAVLQFLDEPQALAAFAASCTGSEEGSPASFVGILGSSTSP